MKAIVVGGGIGGLTAAIALRRIGIEAMVFERADKLREIGAGLALAANATRALGKLGLVDALREIGVPVGSPSFVRGGARCSPGCRCRSWLKR